MYYVCIFKTCIWPGSHLKAFEAFAERFGSIFLIHTRQFFSLFLFLSVVFLEACVSFEVNIRPEDSLPEWLRNLVIDSLFTVDRNAIFILDVIRRHGPCIATIERAKKLFVLLLELILRSFQSLNPTFQLRDQ